MAAGICMQVLSVPGPGAEIVSGPDGIAIAREFNDRMARLISAEPERFAAFAHLPMRSPSAAADELERAVVECGLKGALISGTIDGKFLDAPEFAPVLARAERLDVPLYIHPGCTASRRSRCLLRRTPRRSLIRARHCWVGLARRNGRPHPASRPIRCARSAPATEASDRSYGRGPAHYDGTHRAGI